MAPIPSDRNLQVGILALQLGYINRDQLIQAMQHWLLNRQEHLEDILQAQNALRPDACAALRTLVQQPPAMSADSPAGNSMASGISAGTAWQGEPTTSYQPAADDDSTQRFRVLRPHARGGLGQVSVANDRELNREVALKEILEKFAGDEGSRQRFLLEAEVTGRLEHPSIVPVYSLGQFADGRPFYAMRFIRGNTLSEAIARLHDRQQFPPASPGWNRELRLLIGRLIAVCNAMEYAHSRGILHRDLKPHNIMLGKYGETLVVDWGLAKSMAGMEHGLVLTEGPLKPQSSDDSTATQQGAGMGTPGFMSPEQAEGRWDVLDRQSDVYSLGAILYCLLGLDIRLPVEGQKEILAKVLKRIRKKDNPGAFSSPGTRKAFVPKGLEAITLKAMAIQPAQRYPTAHALADDLERWLADEPVSVYRDPWADRYLRTIRRHKAACITGLALVSMALIGLTITSTVISAKNGQLQEARQQADANFFQARAIILAVLDQAERELSKLPGLEHPRLNITRYAAELFHELHTRKPTDVFLTVDLAEVIRTLANLQRLSGKNEEAAESYREAIGLVEELSDEIKVRECQHYLLVDQAANQRAMGQLRKAEGSLERATILIADLMAANPLDSGYRRARVQLDAELVEVQNDLGKTEEALELGKTCLTYWGELAGTANPDAMDAIYRVMAHATQGKMLLDAKQIEEARQVLRAGISLARADTTGSRDIRSFLYCLLRDLAKTEAVQGQTSPQDRALIEESITGLRALLTDFPRTPLYQEYLATALNIRGEIALASKTPEQALADFQAAIEIIQPLAADLSATISEIEVLADCLVNAGRAERGLSKPAATARFIEAVKTYNSILQRSSDYAPARRKAREASLLAKP